MLPSTVCAALADPVRLRIFGEIAREPSGVPAADLRLAPDERKALEKLLREGLVRHAGGRYACQAGDFRDALAAQEPEAVPLPGASERVAALFSRGRLTDMPRRGALRTEMLRYLAERFDRDRAYSEQEIRDLIAPVYGDHATIRRFLVDEGIMSRDDLGTYWRPD